MKQKKKVMHMKKFMLLGLLITTVGLPVQAFAHDQGRSYHSRNEHYEGHHGHHKHKNRDDHYYVYPRGYVYQTYEPVRYVQPRPVVVYPAPVVVRQPQPVYREPNPTINIILKDIFN